MASPLAVAGAAIQPISAAPLHVNEFFTGYWINGSPLGPGAVPYLYGKFYSASRYDRIVDGNDCEVSVRLTLIRRPGSSVYNPGPFPPINRFYEFRGFGAADEVIRILADCDASANQLQNADFSGGAAGWNWGQDTTHGGGWVLAWGGLPTPPGGLGNVAEFSGAGSADLTNLQHIPIDPGDTISASCWGLGEPGVTGSAALMITFYDSSNAALSVAYSASVPNNYVWTHLTITSITPPAGSAYAIVGFRVSGKMTGDGWRWFAYGFNGSDGYSVPTVREVTQPSTNNVLWNKDPAAGKTSFISDGQNVYAGDGTTTHQWSPNVQNSWQPYWQTPDGTVIVDSNGNLQMAVGNILASIVNIQVVAGVGTNHVVTLWFSHNTPLDVPNNIQLVLSGLTTVPSLNGTTPFNLNVSSRFEASFNMAVFGGNPPLTSFSPETGTASTVTGSGVTGGSPPTWNGTQGLVTLDGGMQWVNMGSPVMAWGAPGPTSAPTISAQTSAGAPAGTGPWEWAYSGKNSITGEISNASPISLPYTAPAGTVPAVLGYGIPSSSWDTIVLWRTAVNGSTLMYDDEFPNPSYGTPTPAPWTYVDTNLDPGNIPTARQGMLNPLITAPINNVNDPPPANFVPKAYYLGRIWGYQNNILRWTGGPDTLSGNGNSTMPPVNQFRLTSKGVVCWPTSVGLICFTSTDIWAVVGDGTANSPFFVKNFQQGIGIATEDAFAVNGSTAYVMLTSHQVISIDPAAGEVEVGFPIGPLFDKYYDPKNTYVTWHQALSSDTALYVADGSTSWVRMAAASAPESGNVWSVPAVIQAPGQVRAMASVEISPGVKTLLIGPNIDGPILQRDLTVNSDNGVSYTAHATIAPLVLAQPGSTASVQFVVTEERQIAGASTLVVKMLFDEIHDFVHIHDQDFRQLRNVTRDPPNLPPSKSLRIQRAWANQDPSTVIKCRFYEQDISWPAEDYPNEIYTNTVYGKLPEKARK